MTAFADGSPHTVRYTIELSPELAQFYGGVAAQAGIPVERVLADALFRLAGELSLHALHEQAQKTADAD